MSSEALTLDVQNESQVSSITKYHNSNNLFSTGTSAPSHLTYRLERKQDFALYLNLIISVSVGAEGFQLSGERLIYLGGQVGGGGIWRVFNGFVRRFPLAFPRYSPGVFVNVCS